MFTSPVSKITLFLTNNFDTLIVNLTFLLLLKITGLWQFEPLILFYHKTYFQHCNNINYKKYNFYKLSIEIVLAAKLKKVYQIIKLQQYKMKKTLS